MGVEVAIIRKTTVGKSSSVIFYIWRCRLYWGQDWKLRRWWKMQTVRQLISQSRVREHKQMESMCTQVEAWAGIFLVLMNSAKPTCSFLFFHGFDGIITVLWPLENGRRFQIHYSGRRAWHGQWHCESFSIECNQAQMQASAQAQSWSIKWLQFTR